MRGTANIALLTRRTLALAAALCAALLLAGHASAQPAEALQWVKIDCTSSDAHFLPPAGIKGECYSAGIEKAQGVYDCRLENQSIGSQQEGAEPHFWARVRYPRVTAKTCATVAFKDPATAMQHAHKFVMSQASNWSDLKTVRDDLLVMFFDAKNQTRDGKCFAFTKTGPPQLSGRGYLFTMIGYFCRAPGQPLDTSVAAGIVDALRLNK